MVFSDLVSFSFFFGVFASLGSSSLLVFGDTVVLVLPLFRLATVSRAPMARRPAKLLVDLVNAGILVR